jgi:hypothetical protein
MPFARYIGTVGQHMTPEAFAALGFDRTVIATEPVTDLAFLDASSIAVRLAEQRGLFTDVRTREFPELIRSLPARKYNPLRTCNRAEVTHAYRLFLNREPSYEELSLGEEHSTIIDLVGQLAASDERHRAPHVQTSRMCTREDVIYAYRLCLHRDPDNNQVLEQHIGKAAASDLANLIWRCDERRKLWDQLVRPLAAVVA